MFGVFVVLFGLSDITQGMSALLLDVAVKGIVILLAASTLVLVLRRASAASRHLVWCVAVGGLLLLPAVSLVAPRWTVPGLSSFLLRSPVMGLTGGLGSVEVRQPVVVRGEQLGERSGAAASGMADDYEARADVGPAVAMPDVEARPTVVADAGPRELQPAATLTEAGRPPAPLRMDRPLTGGMDWLQVLPLAWIVGAIAVLTWILVGMLRTWLLVRSAREVSHGSVRWLFDEVKDELGLSRSVELLQSAVVGMPMVCGVRPRVILPPDADDWTDDRLRAVLLHELAHVKRKDYMTQLVALIAGSLHWFNPLVWIAIRRMRVERELACDDVVLRSGSKASDYAGHLLEIARGVNARAYALLGGVAMARRSRLSDRLLAVLDDTRRRATVTPRMAIAAWAGAACFILPIAGAGAGARLDVPAASAFATSIQPELVPEEVERSAAWASSQLRCDWYDRDASASHWMSGEDDDIQVRITMDDCRLELEVGGEIVFNDAETDIVDISRRGYFEMEEREGRSRRRIVIEPGGSGDLERRWFVDGDERPYDDEASAWLREMIPLLFRRLGMQAEARAGRILEREGVEGVLEEISLIPSDYVARKYYQVLLTDGDLDASQLRSIVRQAGAELESDYELAQLLVEVAESHPVDESVMMVYVEAAGSLDSDYEQRRVLDAILSREDLSAEVAESMLHLATDLESDYELAELLIAVMRRHPIDEVLTTEFFEAVHTLESDYEHNRVLKAALREGAPNLAVLDLALESATELDSDYERAELLLEVATLYPVDLNVPGTYLNAAKELESDYELGRVLKFLIEHQRLSEEALGTVLDAALTLDSDYELANLLLQVVDRYELNETERDTYFEAVTSIDSDYELGRVLKAIVEQGPLTEQNLREVLTSSMALDSEYELANLLIVVANEHRLEGELRTMFMRTLDMISSDYERGRVLSALNPRGGRLN